jgi:hypothetical protein
MLCRVSVVGVLFAMCGRYRYDVTGPPLRRQSHATNIAFDFALGVVDHGMKTDDRLAVE